MPRYGFGPTIDAMLDAISERRGMATTDLMTLLHKNRKTEASGDDGIYDWIEQNVWDQIIGPAIDQLEDMIFGENT